MIAFGNCSVSRSMASDRRGLTRCPRPRTPFRCGIGLTGHDLLDQRSERLNAGSGIAPAIDGGPVDVLGGQVGPGAAAVVVVADGHHPGPTRRHKWMTTAPCLNRGLLIGGDHLVVGAQGLPIPLVGIQAQDASGGEVRVGDEDPRLMLPGFDGIGGRPPADRWPRSSRRSQRR